MSWIREGDTAGMHPITLGVAEHPDADERSIDEVFGYINRCLTLASGNDMDYVITYGTAVTVAGSAARANSLLAIAQFAGYGALSVGPDGRKSFELVQDEKFLHIQTKAERDWEAQRKADNSNPSITVLIRHRDGDVCRYCMKIVNWNDRKSARGGTYDHRPPGVPMQSAADGVVSCKSCNSERGLASTGLAGRAALAASDAVVPLLPPPSKPYYKPSTIEWLRAHGEVLVRADLPLPDPAPTGTRPARAGTFAPYATPEIIQQLSMGSSAEMAPRKGAAPAAPLQAAQEPRSGANAHETGEDTEEPAAPPERQERASQVSRQIPADISRSRQIVSMPNPDSPGRVGTGRGGSREGMDGSGQDGLGSVVAGSVPRRRRRRGGRGSGKGTGDE